MDVIRSALFALIFYPGTVLFVLGGFVAAARGQDALTGLTHAWAGFHRWCAAHLLGIRTRLEGAFPAGPALIAAKHQSMYETVEFLLLLKHPTVVLKRELADLPGWGWIARRYGVIRVDRASGAATLRTMLADAKAAVAAGRSVVIFPEGTRVAAGEAPPLQPGFAGLYKTLGLPVVPVALDSGRVWPRRSFVKRPGAVTFRIGETIPPALPRKEVEARVHAAINALEGSR